MKAIKIGILPQDKTRQRVVAIARGDYKPKAGEPKVWFASMKSLAKVLSDDNRALLDGVLVRVTNVARTVVDCFKYRNKIGLDVALEALREAWRERRLNADDV